MITVGAFALAMSMAVPVLGETVAAGTPSVPATSVSCVAGAVSTREQALGGAMTTYTQAVTGAYAMRATALGQGYALTGGNGSIKSAVQSAWSVFGTSVKSARKGWQTSRMTAWSQFRSAVKACKVPSAVSDGGNSGLEASGQ